MNELGVAGSVNVTQTGVTCAPLGYVESKASSSDGDLCATDYSYWNLAFSGGGLSGSVVSKWDTWKPPAYWFTTVNRISMISSTAPVVFCQSWGWPCDWSTYPDGVDPYIRWDKGDVGDVYVSPLLKTTSLVTFLPDLRPRSFFAPRSSKRCVDVSNECLHHSPYTPSPSSLRRYLFLSKILIIIIIIIVQS